MRALKRLLSLSRAERRLLLRAARLLFLVRLGLWLLPLREVLARVERAVRPGHAPPASAQTLAWAVAAASRAVPRASCLTQALAARLLLAQHGLASEVRFGVGRNEAGVFEAHAWLLHEGQIILGDRPDLSRYAVLPSLERAGTRLLR